MDVLQAVIEWISVNLVPSSLIVGGALLSYYMYTQSEDPPRERPSRARKVGKVSRVLLYPLKSSQPMKEGKSVLVDRMGMKSNDDLKIRDRSWMVTLENGTVQTMRAEPKMILIQPSISPSGDYLLLDAPGMPTLQISTNLNQHNSPTLDVNVWGLHSQAVNCGPEAASWICKYLGKNGFLIMYHPPTMPGRKINEGPHTFHKAFGDEDQIAFADAAPVLLMTQGSINDVISRIDNTDVSTINFRPSIYIEGPKPYEEDEYDEVYIGEKVILKNNILAQRCLGTTIDPIKGEKNKTQEPLKTINGYRTKIKDDPCLGLFMGVLQGGEVNVGDVVYATTKK